MEHVHVEKESMLPGVTCDFVQLFIKLCQLCTLPHDVLPHEEGSHDGHGPPLIAGVKGKLYQGLVQQYTLIPEVKSSPSCKFR